LRKLGIQIKKIAVYLPTQTRSTFEILQDLPEESIRSFVKKIGIQQRHIADDNEYVSDMAVAAAEKLFASGVSRELIDYVILCTQSPDYQLPTTACLVQDRLNLRKSVGAIDINLGCSGYVYSLSLAYALIESNQVNSVLVITADTYTKYIDDKILKAIFGDAATATLITSAGETSSKSYFKFGTDGSGCNHLILRNSGVRKVDPILPSPRLHMEGDEIVKFVLKTIPSVYDALLEGSGVEAKRVKYFIFHQANSWILKLLQNRLKIPSKRFVVNMAKTGNTVSSTIPIALHELMSNSTFSVETDIFMLLGFGVGYSYAGCILNI
jgi:3-oxoacyl-[acyl-carrier-protein] synthase-3